MAGYMVPEVWCDHCGAREVADAEATLAELRQTLKRSGWARRQIVDEKTRRLRVLDLCPADDQAFMEALAEQKAAS